VGEDDGGGEGAGEDQAGETDESADEPAEPADEEGEAGEGDEGEAESEPDDGAAPKAGRRQGRIERLNARLAQEREARERAEAEARAARTPAAPTRNEAEEEAEMQRREEAAGLKYEQRLYNAAQRLQQRSQQRQQQVESVLADKLDAIEFATECQGNELAQKHRDEVEKRLTTMRNAGRNAPRMGLLALILGEQVIKQSKGKPSKRKEEAEARITQRRGEPPGNRSDASNRGARRDDAKAREKRLLGQRI